MSLKGIIQPWYSSILTGDGLRNIRRSWWERKRGSGPHQVTWYHRVDDPYSYLLAQLLPAFSDRYQIELRCITVTPPPRETNPEPELLAEYGLRDARQIAPFYGLTPPGSHTPHISAANAINQRLLALENDTPAYVSAAVELGKAFWEGEAVPIENTSLDCEKSLAENRKQLESQGHYSSGMLHYGGEWYWGIDRLHHLETRLEAAGLGEGHTLPKPDTTLVPVDSTRESDGPITAYLSVRSPYSYVGLHLLQTLASRYDVPLELKPVLPMVMRGLQVPLSKRLYIVLDTKREAAYRGVPFGKICDPLGSGVERALAVYWHCAKPQGKGSEFLLRAMRGAWSEGVELASDKGLRKMVEAVGLSWKDAVQAMTQEGWRQIVEENRQSLYELGMWGVPSIQYGTFSAWGQDRFWLLEAHLATRKQQ